MNASELSIHDHADRETATTPNANMAYISITALVVIACVCVLLLTSARSDLWPSVAMIGSLCGFGAVMSFFVTRSR